MLLCNEQSAHKTRALWSCDEELQRGHENLLHSDKQSTIFYRKRSCWYWALYYAQAGMTVLTRSKMWIASSLLMWELRYDDKEFCHHRITLSLLVDDPLPSWMDIWDIWLLLYKMELPMSLIHHQWKRLTERFVKDSPNLNDIGEEQVHAGCVWDCKHAVMSIANTSQTGMSTYCSA